MVKVYWGNDDKWVELGSALHEDAWKDICAPFLDGRKVKVYYVRHWMSPTDESEMLDYGSHTFFFRYVPMPH
jgi:hypothetical protein